MTHTCPHPPDTLAGVLAIGLADAQCLLERATDAHNGIVFDGARVRLPGKTPVFVERRLRASLSLETLAHIPLDAPPSMRRAPEWTAALTAADELALHAWAGAWRALYGTSKRAARRREADEAFSHRVEEALRDAPPWAPLEGRGARGFSKWVAWARATLAPAVKRAEADTLAEAPDGAEGAATPPAPRTIAEALGVAIDDGRTLLERNRTGTSRYRFESSLWHQKRRGPGDGCAVCAAGVIIARRLDTSDDEEAAPERFAPAWRAALRAIDRIRMHEWAEAFHLMHGAPRHRGAERFAARAPAPADGETWRDAATYTRWLDRAEHVLLPVIAVAEPDALEVR